jgi:hypothetical protein
VVRKKLSRFLHPHFRSAWSEGGGVDRFFNSLNVTRAFGFGVICLALAVGAFARGGWLGWIGGAFLLVLGLSGFVGPVLWPKYRPPAA